MNVELMIVGKGCRTRLRAWMVGVSLALALLWLLVWAGSSWAANAISAENALPGDPHWYRSVAAETSLDIYASQSSVAPGEMLQLHVSAAASTRYEVLVYRLGWYQGNGARLIGCVPACGGDRAGTQYPVPAPDSSTGFLDAGWPVTDSFQVPATAVSGYYLAEAVATTGPSAGRMRFYPFVVRASPGQASAHILVQIGVNTAEAYNPWGGKSLYAFNSTGEQPAVKVSFNRPFQDQGSSSQALDTYQMIRFLERAGFDLSYTTDIDTDGNPGELLRHNLVLIDGHDEYWTKGIYDAFDAARDAGVNLAAFGADIAGWQNRYEDGDRTIVEYRNASADPEADPALKTIEFQNLATRRPQCELFGVEYRGGFDKTVAPIGVPHPYTVMQAAADNAWFTGTGLVSGTVLPGLVGYEWESIKPGCNVPALTELFHWSGSISADSTVYTASSSARVFASGSLDFAKGLDEWPAQNSGVENSGLQRFTLNMLTDLGSVAPATPEQLFPPPTPSPPATPAERFAPVPAMPPVLPSPALATPALAQQEITALSVSPASFRAARKGGGIARRRLAPAGATVAYTDTSAGATTFTLSMYAKCPPPRQGSRGHARTCLRRVPLAHFVRQDNAGANGFRLTGRLHGRTLVPGRYLLTAIPLAGMGTRGGRSAGFTIVG